MWDEEKKKEKEALDERTLFPINQSPTPNQSCPSCRREREMTRFCAISLPKKGEEGGKVSTSWV